MRLGDLIEDTYGNKKLLIISVIMILIALFMILFYDVVVQMGAEVWVIIMVVLVLIFGIAIGKLK